MNELDSLFSSTDSIQSPQPPTVDSPLSQTPQPEDRIVPLAVKVLHPSTMSELEIQEVRAVVREWKKSCYNLLSAAQKETVGKQIVKDTSLICRIIARYLKDYIFNPDDMLLLSTEAESSKVHGVAILYKTQNFVIIQDLVTNPENIRAPINRRTSQKVRGAGTSVIAEAARMCISEGKQGLYLKALPKAVEFYRRCGFEPIDATEETTPSLFLSTQKLKTQEISSLLLKNGVSLTPDIVESKNSRQESSGSDKKEPVAPEQREDEKSHSSELRAKVVVKPKSTFFFRRQNLLRLSEHLFFTQFKRKTQAKTRQNRKRTFQTLINTLDQWKFRCYRILGESATPKPERHFVKVVKKFCTIAKSHLGNINYSTDYVFTCKNKETHKTIGIALVSKLKRYIIIKDIVIHPDTIIGSKQATYAKSMSESGRTLLARIMKAFDSSTNKLVYAKTLVEEIPFYENCGFERVDSNEASSRMLATVQALRQRRLFEETPTH